MALAKWSPLNDGPTSRGMHALPVADIGAQSRPALDINRRVFSDVRGDVSVRRHLAVDRSTAVGASRGFSRTHLHHSARLRTRVILSFVPCQQPDRDAVQPDDADALRVLASAACQTSRLLEQSRPARGERARYLLVVYDGRGIPRPGALAASP